MLSLLLSLLLLSVMVGAFPPLLMRRRLEARGPGKLFTAVVAMVVTEMVTKG